MLLSYSAVYDEKSTDSYFYLDGNEDYLHGEEYKEKDSYCEDDFYYDDIADYYDSYFDDYNDY